VEITELNYDVLSWDAVSDSLFDPVASLPGTAITGARPVPPVSANPHSAPVIPTKEQLDYAELQALLTLNRANADTGEQVRVSRLDNEILVKGIVDTDQRKEELLAALRSVSHIASSILSIEELNSESAPTSAPITSVKQYSVAGSPSPLEDYLHKQSRSMEEINRISHAVLSASVAAGIEGGSLTELQQRFVAPDLSVSSAVAFDELVKRHLDRLSASLDEEEEAIRQIGVPLPVLAAPDGSSREGAAKLLPATIESNRILCRELITGSSDPARSVDVISIDLFNSITTLRSVLKTMSQMRKTAPAADRRM
jgi:hypothetical protein